MLIFLLTQALASPPDAVVHNLSAASVYPTAFNVSADGAWLSFLGDEAAFVDLGAWEVHVPDCGATATAADSGDQLYAACGSTVSQYAMVNGALTYREDVWVADGAISGLWAYDGDLYVLVVGESLDRLHRVTDSGSQSSWDVQQGLAEGRLRDGRLYLWHTADDVTTLSLPAGSAVPSTAFATGTPVDLAVSYQQTPYMVVREFGTVLELVTATNYQIVASGLNDPTALAFSADLSDPWAVLDTANGLEVRDASGGLGAVLSTLSVGGRVRDAVAIDNAAVLGVEGGGLAVATAAPWVEASVDPASATAGTEVILSFTVDRDATYDVLLSGTSIASGSAVADAAVEVPFTVDDRFSEGATGLWVVATADGEEGSDRVDVIVDSAPPAPDLSVGFQDGGLTVVVGGVDDTDLDHFVIYASTEAFAAEDYTSGGPADFDPEDELVLPVEVDATPGEAVQLTLSPLDNGVSYTIGARAVDAGGLEGPMSETVTESPREIYSAAELAGEGGGVSCGTTSGPAWLGVFGLLGLLGRRRSALAAGLLAASSASANPLCSGAKTQAERQASYEKPGRDATPTCADFEARYGSRSVEDESIRALYGSNSHGMLMLEAGPQIFRVVEIDLGFGLYRKFDRAVSLDGAEAEVGTMFTMWPLMLGGTFRLQLLDEQLVVPFVRAGIDYIMFGERWDNGQGGRDVVKGAKFGHHFGGGVNILLDPFAPARASLLEASTGINDTFLTVEYRKTNANPGEGFDLSGSNLSVGIKLDY